LDATEKGHTGLAAYYAERGEAPGVWMGSGMAGIDGLDAGDAVTAEQMRALFGCGLHPLAELRMQQLEGPDLTERDYQAVTRLGVPFKILDGDVSPFRREVAERIAGINEAAGLPADWPVPAADRAQVHTEVAREFFLAEHGREPMDPRELAGQIAKDSRPRTQTVAGYDLTFSPVKSVSALWAVADPTVAAMIERAHQSAVKDALAFIEEHALFTGPDRRESGGRRQGLVATAFTGTAGPATPICHPCRGRQQGPDPRRTLAAIDGRVLFRPTSRVGDLQHSVGAAPSRHLGVRFAERPNSSDPGSGRSGRSSGSTRD
jgi:hypothetical protein